MRDLIRRTLHGARLLIAARPEGRHARRLAARRPVPSVPPTRPAPARPAPEIDLSYFDDPAFGGELDMVRPYVLLYEQQRQRERKERELQARRRMELDPAPRGSDAGSRLNRGMEVGAQ